MSDDSVLVIGPYGEKGTVARADLPKVLPQVEAAGGRLATAEEEIRHKLGEAYAKAGTGAKVAGVLAPALPAPVQSAVRGAGLAVLPPELEAYRAGASEMMTGGLEALGTKGAIGALSGEDAAKAYVQGVEDLKRAHSTAYGAGEAAGIAGSIISGGAGGAAGTAGRIASPLLSTAGIAGSFAERQAAKALAGMAARGALGRAVATGGELAARGAIEGGILTTAQQLGDAAFTDHELAADKFFTAVGIGALGGALGGAALGGAGSLAASGVRGATAGIREGLTRMLPEADAAAVRAADAGAEAEAKGVEAAAGAKEGEATAADFAAAKRARREVARQSPVDMAVEGRGTEAARAAAYDQAAKSLTGGGLSSTKPYKKALQYLDGGMRDVGEVMVRKGIPDVDAGLGEAFAGGAPEAMLPKIETELAATGKRLGELTDASGARVPVKDVAEALESVVAPLRSKALHEGIVSSLERDMNSILSRVAPPMDDALKAKYAAEAAAIPREIQLNNPAAHQAMLDEIQQRMIADHAASATSSVQDLLTQRKALDDIIYRESTPLNPSPLDQERRAMRAKLEDLIADAIDSGSGKQAGTLKDEYKALKKDYFALSVARDIAADTVARGAKNQSLGLTDKMLGMTVGAMAHTVGIPGIVAGPAAAYASKYVKQRGNAVAAVLLHRLAETGAAQRVISRVDEMVGDAARGMLSAPKARALGDVPPTSIRERAAGVMDRIAAAQANPDQVVNDATRATEPLNAAAPMLAGAIQRRLTDGAAFLASKMPVTNRQPSMFDPNPKPRLTDAEAAKLVRYDQYLQQPALILHEAANGRLTHEGAEVMKTLAPGMFRELQMQTMATIADMMTKGIQIPFQQQQRIGILLDIPAVSSQRPEVMRLLQTNVVGSEQAANATPGPQGAPQSPRRPIQNKTQQSEWDRLEGR